MDDKILIQDLAEQLAAAEGLQKSDAQAFVRAFFDTVIKGLENDKYVKVKGLGTFKLVEVDSRESINVNTGERFMIDGHAKISFTPDNVLKELVNKPFAQFETVVLNDEVTEDELEAVDRKFEQVAVAEEVVEEVIDEPAPIVVPTHINPAAPETPTVPEEPVAHPTPVVVETSSVVEEPKKTPEEPAPIAPTVSAEPSEPQPVRSNKHLHLIWAVICLVALPLGYLLGYFHVLLPESNYHPTVIRDTVFVQKVVHDTIQVEKIVPNELIKEEPESAEKAQQTPAISSDIPQLKGGAYLIVGTKETYKLRGGETIRIIAERYYGSREMAPYISIYNNIEDPNKVVVGTILKIPELKRKTK